MLNFHGLKQNFQVSKLFHKSLIEKYLKILETFN